MTKKKLREQRISMLSRLERTLIRMVALRLLTTISTRPRRELLILESRLTQESLSFAAPLRLMRQLLLIS